MQFVCIFCTHTHMYIIYIFLCIKIIFIVYLSVYYAYIMFILYILCIALCYIILRQHHLPMLIMEVFHLLVVWQRPLCVTLCGDSEDHFWVTMYLKKKLKIVTNISFKNVFFCAI